MYSITSTRFVLPSHIHGTLTRGSPPSLSGLPKDRKQATSRVVTFVRRFFLHDQSHSHQSAPFADDDGEVEYNKHLIEKKAAREKPPRRQQYTNITQVARYAPCYVWELDLHRDARGQSRRRGGRCEDGVVDLPDRGGREGRGIEVHEEGAPRRSER